jgi:hypothetical protein
MTEKSAITSFSEDAWSEVPRHVERSEEGSYKKSLQRIALGLFFRWVQELASYMAGYARYCARVGIVHRSRCC